MKKIIIIFIYLLSIINYSNADFWSPTSLNLYNNIDRWYQNMNERMETYELKWWEQNNWLLPQLNKYAILNQETPCLNENKVLSVNDFKKIINTSDISLKTWIMKYLSPTCTKAKTQNKVLLKYLQLFKQYNKEKILTAWIKSKQIYKISKIWLYSDWDIWNSWFDLITDIEEIDKIIFSHVVDYYWEPNEKIDDALNSFLAPLIKTVNKLSSPNFKNTKWNTNNTNIWNIPHIVQTPNIIISNSDPKLKETQNIYKCSTDIKESGLSANSLKWLIYNINQNLNPKQHNNNYEINNINKEKKWKINNSSNIKKSNWKYEKVRDNSLWPCETFFCINIDFISYQHNLFWAWEDITIEYLLNRSNKHLAKAAATSLIPAKMSTNEFELWLKDLSLPDIFHMSIQILTKPIPILNIEKETKKDETEYSAKNMMIEYYKSYWLDYNRRNDLILFNKTESDKQNTNNSYWLTNENLLQKQYENDKIVKEREKKIATIKNAIYSKVSYWPIWTFEEQFTELDKFTLWIKNYVETLNSLIIKLNKIPIEY